MATMFYQVATLVLVLDNTPTRRCSIIQDERKSSNRSNRLLEKEGAKLRFFLDY